MCLCKHTEITPLFLIPWVETRKQISQVQDTYHKQPFFFNEQDAAAMFSSAIDTNRKGICPHCSTYAARTGLQSSTSSEIDSQHI